MELSEDDAMTHDMRRSDDREAGMLFAHERRIGRLEDGHLELTRCVAAMRAEQHRQTELTSTIASDTAALRDMLKGLRVAVQFAMGAGTIAGALVSAYYLGEIVMRMLG